MLIAAWIPSAYKPGSGRGVGTRRRWLGGRLNRTAEPERNPPVLVEQRKSTHLPALFTFHKPPFPVFHLFAADLIGIRISCRATPASLPVRLFAGERPVCVCVCVHVCKPQTSINGSEKAPEGCRVPDRL